MLHSDHCAKKLLPWFDGMLEADEKYFKEHGEPLYSSVLWGNNMSFYRTLSALTCLTCLKNPKRITSLNVRNTLREWPRWTVSILQTTGVKLNGPPPFAASLTGIGNVTCIPHPGPQNGSRWRLVLLEERKTG